MNREDIAVVALRLFVLSMIFGIIRTLPNGVQMLSGPEGGLALPLFISFIVVGFTFCIFLWKFALFIARKLLPVMREPSTGSPIDPPAALALGLVLIGIWFLTGGLIDLVYWLTILMSVERADEPHFRLAPEHIANMVSTVLQIAISLGLVLGSSAIRQLIYRFRYGNNAPTSE